MESVLHQIIDRLEGKLRQCGLERDRQASTIRSLKATLQNIAYPDKCGLEGSDDIVRLMADWARKALDESR